MNKKTSPALLAMGLLVLASLSCQKKAQIKGVELAVDFSAKMLTDNLITDIQYDWKTSGDFPKAGKDLTVYVHFWHGSNMLFQDDHMPPVPTSQWEPGKEYKYQRRIYIPSFIDEFDPAFKGEEVLRLSVGLYNPYDRSGDSQRQVLATKLKVLPPPPDVPEIVYEKGWHDQEIDPNAPLKKWRWASGEARCIVDNPHRDGLLVIRGGVSKEAAPDQKVLFKINDMVLDEFIPDETTFERSYTVKKEMLGEKDEFTLTVAVDKTFIPSKVFPQNKDERELGCQISFIYFR
ncbi:MAG: hypothetical protein A2V45_06380 [Candidatus Aminicenantes bacterium RBG_19FT_COMBO_58_17]|jgi:hypothetical protein|nr:MAG: hypothetical protein A2V45_06380 [Candidatus Aminicenantes bacterium RBG_19FT_COMBO_58_17]HCS47618.1 hypothetical protein [Candidatus Aminicenantes bacterium]